MKLLTPELRVILPPLYSQENAEVPVVHCKFFCPWSNWTWFVTEGELVAPDGEDGLGDSHERTTFVDGSNKVEDLRRNGWQLPLTAGSSAVLHVVLRDERGGVGWTARSFDVVGGEK